MRKSSPPAITRTLGQNGAFLWVDDLPETGTSLSVYFPSAAESVLGMPDRGTGKRLGGTETILVVEDDLALREATSEYLRGLGYRVLRAGNGEEALQTAKSSPRIDALVADLRMPKLGGEELAERLSVSQPGIRIMFVSGNFDSEFLARRSSQRITLAKPFELRVLAGMLRDLLDGGAHQTTPSP